MPCMMHVCMTLNKATLMALLIENYTHSVNKTTLIYLFVIFFFYFCVHRNTWMKKDFCSLMKQ